MDRTGAAILLSVFAIVAGSIAVGLALPTSLRCACPPGIACFAVCPSPWAVLPYTAVIGAVVGAPAAALAYGSYRRGLVRPARWPRPW